MAFACRQHPSASQTGSSATILMAVAVRAYATIQRTRVSRPELLGKEHRVISRSLSASDQRPTLRGWNTAAPEHVASSISIFEAAKSSRVSGPQQNEVDRSCTASMWHLTLLTSSVRAWRLGSGVPTVAMYLRHPPKLPTGSHIDLCGEVTHLPALQRQTTTAV